MSIEEILADVKAEGDKDPFADMEKASPSESLPEKEPVKEEPKVGEEKAKDEPSNTPEENIPFHKHPRWIERENELKSLREREDSYNREIQELKAFKEDTVQKLSTISSDKTNVPDWFKELYGENEVAWQKYEQREKVREEEIERRVFEKQEAQRNEASQKVQKWNSWVDQEVAKLQAETGVDFTSLNDVLPNGEKANLRRNELIKTILDYRPTDDNGNFDFKKGYQIYDAMKSKETDPAHSIARKQLADTTTKSSPAQKQSKDYMTAAELRNKSWNSL